MIIRNAFHLVNFGAASQLTLGLPEGDLIEVDFTLWDVQG